MHHDHLQSRQMILYRKLKEVAHFHTEYTEASMSLGESCMCDRSYMQVGLLAQCQSSGF